MVDEAASVPLCYAMFLNRFPVRARPIALVGIPAVLGKLEGQFFHEGVSVNLRNYRCSSDGGRFCVTVDDGDLVNSQ